MANGHRVRHFYEWITITSTWAPWIYSAFLHNLFLVRTSFKLSYYVYSRVLIKFIYFFPCLHYDGLKNRTNYHLLDSNKVCITICANISQNYWRKYFIVNSNANTRITNVKQRQKIFNFLPLNNFTTNLIRLHIVTTKVNRLYVSLGFIIFQIHFSYVCTWKELIIMSTFSIHKFV